MKIKKWDILIIVGILVVSTAVALALHLDRGQEDGAVTAEIYVDGKLTQTLPLPAVPTQYTLENEEGYNILLLGPYSAKMIEADCPSQDCVHTPTLTQPGQVIACLPHRLVVRLVGPAVKDGVDTVVS